MPIWKQHRNYNSAGTTVVRWRRTASVRRLMLGLVCWAVFGEQFRIPGARLIGGCRHFFHYFGMINTTDYTRLSCCFGHWAVGSPLAFSWYLSLGEGDGKKQYFSNWLKDHQPEDVSLFGVFLVRKMLGSTQQLSAIAEDRKTYRVFLKRQAVGHRTYILYLKPENR